MNIYLKLFFTTLFIVYTIDALANMIGTAFSNSFSSLYSLLHSVFLPFLVTVSIADSYVHFRTFSFFFQWSAGKST